MAAHPLRLPRPGVALASGTPGFDKPAVPVNEFSTPRVGRLVALDAEARPLVSFAGGPDKPVVARVVTTEPCPSESALRAQPAVLLVFENGDPQQPVIVGFVREGFAQPQQELALTTNPARSVELNGKVLVFEGQEEIVLRCGQGSITLRADGQIVLKGTRLTSRASQTNKIRGASVQIN